jgi:hypothetical protein
MNIPTMEEAWLLVISTTMACAICISQDNESVLVFEKKEIK